LDPTLQNSSTPILQYIKVDMPQIAMGISIANSLDLHPPLTSLDEIHIRGKSAQYFYFIEFSYNFPLCFPIGKWRHVNCGFAEKMIQSVSDQIDQGGNMALRKVSAQDKICGHFDVFKPLSIYNILEKASLIVFAETGFFNTSSVLGSADSSPRLIYLIGYVFFGARCEVLPCFDSTESARVVYPVIGHGAF